MYHELSRALKAGQPNEILGLVSRHPGVFHRGKSPIFDFKKHTSIHHGVDHVLHFVIPSMAHHIYRSTLSTVQ